MKRKELRNGCIRMVVAAVLISMPIILRRLLPPKWISSAFKPVSRYISRVLSKISGIFRFSIAEILLYLVVASVLFYIVFTVIRIIRKKDPPIYILRCLSRVVLGLCSLVFLFNTLWGFNYYSLSLASELKMDIGRYSVETLRLATESFVVELNAISSEIPRFHNGVSKFESFDELADKAIEGWTNLAKSNAAFSSVRVAKPKRLSSVASELMSRAGITGIYIPFTGEANVNVGIPDSSLPFTMSHELAHSAGVAPENEANFAAFLACRESPHAEFRYSGYLSAFVYSYNALYREDPEGAYELMFSLNREVLADLQYRSEYWRRYSGEMRKVATKVNNTYLVAMKQTDGVKSYGMVVDLLIADFLARNTP
ncbi:MAG: DUF3810 domain-containing protein [Clostridiales bacterium]|nr:DUF3810 domain-containing protein [Clostridiales bacterium]